MPAVVHSSKYGPKHVTAIRKREVKEAICGHVVQFCYDRFGTRLRAIILTGSMARDEEIVVSHGPGDKVLGDAEFLLVFDENIPLPGAGTIEPLCIQLQEELHRQAIICPISIAEIHAEFLSRLRPHIFSFELRENGKVLSGDTTVLSLIGRFEKGDIPRGDAWRLLSNRIIEQLAIIASLSDVADPLPIAAFAQTSKLVLDSATSLLVFVGHYAPNYRRRQELLSNWAAYAQPTVPFSPATFAHTVASVTRWRLGESSEHPTATFEFLLTAIEWAQELWVWELRCLTGLGKSSEPQDVMFEWMRLQPRLEQLRGWLYVLRSQKWARSWRQWPRWIGLARRSSPRYCIYAAAAKLLSSAPALLNCGSSLQRSEWIGAREWLPMKLSLKSNEEIKWQELAQEVVWNYKTFLAGTQT